MKLFISLVVVGGLAACGGGKGGGGGATEPAGGGGNIGTIKLENTSHFDIYSIQLSPYDQVEWGRNLIEGDALLHGELAQVEVFDCKKYDLRMVDDEKVECVIQDIDLCFEDKHWVFDDGVLATCATGWAD